ncbi:MAG: shikimate kinase [Chloroflexota bacterium]
MAKPVFLIGYMGCGKSTVGKKLATRLKFDFIDTDSAIENMTGKPVSVIFEQEGEDAFRLLENSVLKSLAARNNIVIATGGGTPCFYDNMAMMNRSGITIYVKMHPDSLAKRIIDSKTERPLLRRISDNDLPSYIANHLNARERFYNQAQLTVKGENLKIDELHLLIQNNS